MADIKLFYKGIEWIIKGYALTNHFRLQLIRALLKAKIQLALLLHTKERKRSHKQANLCFFLRVCCWYYLQF
jgi:hypothetical protein